MPFLLRSNHIGTEYIENVLQPQDNNFMYMSKGQWRPIPKQVRNKFDKYKDFDFKEINKKLSTELKKTSFKTIPDMCEADAIIKAKAYTTNYRQKGIPTDNIHTQAKATSLIQDILKKL